MRTRTVRRTLRGVLLAAALPLATLAGCATAPAAGAADAASSSAAARPRGTLLVVGGGPAPAEIPRRFVELAGGAGARIVVFPMASADTGTGPEKVAELRALGADAVSVALTRETALREESARLLDGATGIWFSGGDQNRLTRAVAGTPVERAIHARYRAGAVVGGTSAGAAVMSARMITGDERRPGGDRPPRDASDAWLTVARDNVVTAPGFGLLPGVVVDQHFLRRKRHNRLLSLVLELPERLAVGIDESTALEIGPDGRWRVLGASSALVLDAREARVAERGTLAAAGVRLHLLPAGATFDPATGRATLPAAAP
jgi:cyanophycinase